MESLRIGSVNCRGLFSDQIKRRDFFDRCRNNFDITFLIDTHSPKAVEKFGSPNGVMKRTLARLNPIVAV